MSKTLHVDTEQELEEVFTVFDINSDGFISTGELKEILSRLGETITQVIVIIIISLFTHLKNT